MGMRVGRMELAGDRALEASVSMLGRALERAAARGPRNIVFSTFAFTVQASVTVQSSRRATRRIFGRQDRDSGGGRDGDGAFSHVGDGRDNCICITGGVDAGVVVMEDKKRKKKLAMERPAGARGGVKACQHVHRCVCRVCSAAVSAVARGRPGPLHPKSSIPQTQQLLLPPTHCSTPPPAAPRLSRGRHP